MDISAYQHMNIRMSTRGKRPLRNLTPSDKVRAIQRIHNGETKASVSRDIGVPESTLRGWCKNEQKLRFMCRQLGAADQLTPMSGIENPPEKRPRFDNHIQTPKFPASTTFDEFGYSRLPLNGLSFSSNGSNAILEKIAFNEIMKKHIMPADSANKQPENISNQMSGIMGGPIPMGAGGDYNTQLSMMQNLNLLSLLSPNLAAMPNLKAAGNGSLEDVKTKIPLRPTDESKDIAKANGSVNFSNSSNNNINQNSSSINNTASLSVKNWAKDPAEKNLLNLTNQNINGSSNNAAINSSIGNNRNINDSNNNSVKDKNTSYPIENSTPVDVSNFPPPLPLGLLQIPNISQTPDSDNGNTALLEWCKVFNASLNFLALAAAAAALQPNGALNAANAIKKEDNILYKELTKTASNFDSPNNPTSFITSDVSNDSYFDSEPEDLSVRSTATSKLSSPANSRSQSPVKSNGSCSPLQSDGEH